MNYRNLVTVIGFCVLSCVIPANGGGDEVDLLIQKSLIASGVSRQLEMLPATLLSAVPADAFPDARARSGAAELLKKSAGKDILTATVSGALARQFDKNNLLRVIDFYESGLGKKVGRLQGAALEAGTINEIREGRRMTASLDEDRLALLRRIIKAEQVTETNTSLMNIVVKALTEGGTTVPHDVKDVGPKSLQPLPPLAFALSLSTEDVALVGYAHTFRSLTNSELQELAAYSESQAAGWFRNAVRQGLETAVFTTARAVAQTLKKDGSSLPSQ